MADTKLLETIQNFCRTNKNYQPDFVEFSAIMYKLSNLMLDVALDKTTTGHKSRTTHRPNDQQGPRTKQHPRQ